MESQWETERLDFALSPSLCYLGHLPRLEAAGEKTPGTVTSAGGEDISQLCVANTQTYLSLPLKSLVSVCHGGKVCGVCEMSEASS